MRRECRDSRLGDFWVEYEPANLVDWGGLRVPEMFTASFPAKDLAVRIEIVLEEERPECIALSRLNDDAPPLSSERRFPVRGMVDAAVRGAAFELVEVPIDEVDPRRENERLVPDENGLVRVYAPAFSTAGTKARGLARKPAAEPVPDLSRVAELYRRAVAAGMAPSREIAGEYGITPATARKWVQRARERGFLAPALGRRAGEARAAR
jgi:helix-turn-helix protein